MLSRRKNKPLNKFVFNFRSKTLIMEERSNKLDMNKGCFDVSVFGVSKHFFTTFLIIPTHLKYSQYTVFDMI